MATTLPARVEEYTALQAQSTFTDAEKAAFKELYDYISTHTKDNIQWYWELGQKVAKIHKEAQAKKELYGKKVLLRQAIALGFKTDRQLHNAMAVCKAFGTKKAFNEYIKLRGEAGNMLQWSHIVYLAGVGDEDMRMQLAAATLEQAWTAEELWSKVKALCERRSRGTRSPKTKVPTSARGCLTHVRSQASKFNFNFDNAWTGDAFDLRQTVKDTPADKLNEKFLESVQATRQEVSALQAKATELSNILSLTEADIQARIEAQQALEAQLAEEEEDEDPPAVDDEDDDEVINLGEKRNAEQRAKRAAEREKAKKRKGPQRPGRVGTSR